MSERQAVIANSRPDRHGEICAPQGLRTLVKAATQRYLPLNVEHDPRRPPLGRIKSAQLRSCSDGALEVLATLEIFDDQKYARLSRSRRQYRPIPPNPGRLVISHDRSYENKADTDALRSLATDVGGELERQYKKSVDPISTLAVTAGVFIVGSIAKGFLGKLGADTYEKMKSGLKGLFRTRKDGEKEKLLELKLVVQKGSQSLLVDVVATNPSADDIDEILGPHLERLDVSLSRVSDERRELRLLVYEIKDGELLLKFGVRKDCVPIVPMETSLQTKVNAKMPVKPKKRAARPAKRRKKKN